MPRICHDVKDNILSVTKTILSQEDGADFTMRDVAKQCGIALGTIYNYYPSKADLLIEICAEIWDKCFTEMRQVDDEDFFVCIEQFYRMITKYFDAFSRNTKRSLGGLNKQGKQASNVAYTSYYDACKDIVANTIKARAHQLDGKIIQAYSIDSIASFVLNHLVGMATTKDFDYGQFDYFAKKLFKA